VALTLADAKRAISEAREGGPSRRDADDYGISTKKSEPADPRRVDHEHRRQTRLAPDEYEHGLSDPFYECGCDDCPDVVDPLADASAGFEVVSKAADMCPNPRPVTVEKAREIYLRYQYTAWKDRPWRSKLEQTQDAVGKLYGAERSVFERMGNPTLVFLSLRLSPIERDDDGSRRWVHPSLLMSRLADSWDNVKSVLRYQLREYDSEYAWIIGFTDSAATPHRHVAVYVDDPDNEIGVGVAESAVKSHVRHCPGATEKDHPVEKGQNDAAIVEHDISKALLSDETISNVYAARRTESFSLPSVRFSYMMNQQPHWALKNVYDPTDDTHADSVAVDGAAIAWALPWRLRGSSAGFVDEAID
jgi:hypothetical protein